MRITDRSNTYLIQQFSAHFIITQQSFGLVCKNTEIKIHKTIFHGLFCTVVETDFSPPPPPEKKYFVTGWWAEYFEHRRQEIIAEWTEFLQTIQAQLYTVVSSARGLQARTYNTVLQNVHVITLSSQHKSKCPDVYITVSWHLTQCSLVNGYKRFEGTCYLQLQCIFNVRSISSRIPKFITVLLITGSHRSQCNPFHIFTANLSPMCSI